MKPFFNLSKQDFLAKISEPQTILLDVRNEDEFQQGHLENALLVPFENPDFISMMSDFDASANYLVYCRSGNRGAKACLMMRSMGFHGELFHLENGYDGLNS